LFAALVTVLLQLREMLESSDRWLLRSVFDPFGSNLWSIGTLIRSNNKQSKATISSTVVGSTQTTSRKLLYKSKTNKFTLDHNQQTLTTR